MCHLLDRENLMKRLRATCLLVGALVVAQVAMADAPRTVAITISHQRFSPDELPLPPGVQVKLLIRNADNLPAEFESNDLSREVIVPAHGRVTIYIGPLSAGRYRFFNDFNHAAQGWVTVGDPAHAGGN